MKQPLFHIPERGSKLLIYFSKTKAELPLNYALMGNIRRAVRETLAYENFQAEGEVSFTLCDNEHIRVLNRDFRQKDMPTDVLSFPMEGAGDVDMGGMSVMLGDIVVSYEKAAEQAEELGHTVSREIVFLTVHSVLHLLGYDHETGEEDEQDMLARQRAVMQRLYPDEIQH